MTELLGTNKEEIIAPNLGGGKIVADAIDQGWMTCEATTLETSAGVDVLLWVDDTTVVPPLDSSEVVDKVQRRAENELFGWSQDSEVFGLLKDTKPTKWFVLSSGITTTHVLNFSSRELSTEDAELIRSAHEKTSRVTGGASAQATKAIVIADQAFVGSNKFESRASNGRARPKSGVIILSERIFDPEDISTKEYVRDSDASQAEAVLAHEEVHQAQLGEYSPITRSRYDHLDQFKSASGWTERSYDLPGGRHVISGIGNAVLMGEEVELPISAYGNLNAKEDTAESGAALVIGMNPGKIRTDSITQLQRASYEARPELANIEFSINERPLDTPLGSSHLDYPKEPIAIRVVFVQNEGD